MRFLFLTVFAAMVLAVSLNARGAAAEPHTVFLLDLSGSMEFPVKGRKRIDLAKSALSDTFATRRYPASELIMWNTGMLRETYGNGPELTDQVAAAPTGVSGSDLGSAFLSLSEAGYSCSHIVFVTDEFPDDARNFQQAIDTLLARSRQNTVTVYVVDHPESYYYAGRFASVSGDARYRVVDGRHQASLADYLADNPVKNACGTLS